MKKPKETLELLREVKKCESNESSNKDLNVQKQEELCSKLAIYFKKCI